jgi:hypothetical protein
MAAPGVAGSDLAGPGMTDLAATEPGDAAQPTVTRNGQPNEDAGSPATDTSTAAVNRPMRSEVHTPAPLEEIAEVLGIDDESPADRPRGARP